MSDSELPQMPPLPALPSLPAFTELHVLYNAAAAEILKDVAEHALRGLGLAIFEASQKGTLLQVRELEAARDKLQAWVSLNR